MSVQQEPVVSVSAPPRGSAVPPRLVLAVVGGLVLALMIVGPPLSALAQRCKLGARSR
jgi:hypothetical protein